MALLGTFDLGDTIQPVATFHDWAPVGTLGALIDPSSIVVTIYDSEQNPLGTLIYVRESLGVFHADWVLPVFAGTYFIEFKGVISGEPAINRASVKVKFAV